MTRRQLCLTMAVSVAILLGAFFWLTPEGRWLVAYYRTPAKHFDSAPANLPDCKDCNLILVSLDTLRGDRLGFVNPEVKFTPHLDKIAQRSVVFENVYTTAFYTTPSHMTVFTSLYPHQHSVTGSDIHLPRNLNAEGQSKALDSKYQTLAEVLKTSGYRTTWAAPLKLKHLDFTLGFGRGFDTTEPPLFERTINLQSDRQAKFHSQRLQELASGPQPFFLFLHSYITHQPYYLEGASLPALDKKSLIEKFFAAIKAKNALGKSPEATSTEMRKVCSDPKLLEICYKKYVTPERLMVNLGQFQFRELSDIPLDQIPSYKQAYDHSVKMLDDQIGDMWAGLEKAGVLQNTIVVFFSDHGEELFEHSRSSHSSFFEHTARVMLMIYHPKLQNPQRNSQLVSLVDLMPTALRMLAIEGPQGQMRGQSLSEPRKDEYVYGYSLGNDFVTDGTWKLLTEYTGRQKLFYLPLDPKESNNLSDKFLPQIELANRRLKQKRSQFETGL